MMTYQETYLRWMECVKEEDLLSELSSIKDDDEQIKERFLGDLPFGTAGLRGIIGAGMTRMNRYVVGRATQGLSDYLLANGKAAGCMVIAYDSRQFSREFAVETACVFAGNGITARIFKQMTSVPELSFAVRYLKAQGGIVITASHNPPRYNGYKVYDAYGGQLGPEESLAVMECIRTLDPFTDVKRIDYGEGVAGGLILEIGEEIDRAYYQRMVELCGTENTDDLKVVYTPIHGTGMRTVENIFPAAGIRNYVVVEEQREPDGLFPTVKSPNPEEPDAMKMAIELAGRLEADLAIGTDPDADRMGAAVRRPNGTYAMLTGNQVGCLLTDYLLDKRRSSGKICSSDYIVKSFVSTGMADAIARHYGVRSYTVLTGFRFIADCIKKQERKNADFIFGFEESFGFLAGSFVRDKDGAMGALLLCKAAQHYQQRGKSLLDALETLYETHGYYLESVKNIAFTGLDGMEKMKAIMARLREKPIAAVGGLAVKSTEDYLSRTCTDASGIVSAIELPATNALKLILEKFAWICIRPSGTEPKIKIYYAVCADTREAAEAQIKSIETGFGQIQ
jgi:phosphoglucomutase